MKRACLYYIITLIAMAFTACKLDNLNPDYNIPVQPVDTGTSDTSRTLITNTSLVGNWNIVSDTVSLLSNVMYKGVPGDHFIFTKYGNLYINNGLNKQIDTAVYTISANNKVQWVYSFWSVNGSYSRSSATVGAYDIKLVSDSLILTQKSITPEGPFYERVKLIKK